MMGQWGCSNGDIITVVTSYCLWPMGKHLPFGKC
jgi:hypothetical protein